MRPVLLVVLGAALLAACDRSTQEPADPQSTGQAPGGPIATPPVVTQNPACTHQWANPVNGSWENPAMWSPASVPGSTSVACIQVAGTYTVSLDPTNDNVPVTIDALTLGAASGTQTLQIAGTAATLTVAKGIEIGANAALATNTSGATKISATTVLNQGTLRQTVPCGGGCGLANTLTADLVNNGRIEIATGLTLDKVNGSYQNLGVIAVTGSTPGLAIPASAGSPEFRQDGGSVTGGFNAGLISIGAGTFYLNGGDVGALQIGTPIVRIEDADLIIGPATTIAGNVGFRSKVNPTKSITGDIPAQLRVSIMGGLNGQSGDAPSTATFSGATVVKGTLSLEHVLGSGFVAPLRIAGVGPLTIEGNFIAIPTSALQSFLSLEVINHGTMTLSGRVTLDRAPATYRNTGTIVTSSGNADQIFLVGTTFVNTGTISNGTIFVQEQSLLTGTGALPSIRVETGGQVAPGVAGTGRMTVTNYFSPDNTGSLAMEVGGRTPGVDYDQLVVTNQMNFSGTLVVSPVAGAGAGLCGQVFVLVEHGSPGGSGEFPTIGTTGLAAGHAFRFKYVTTAPKKLIAYGYSPDVKVGVDPAAIALTEGQPGVQYAVCLGSRPSGTVTVTPSFGNQVTVSPASLTYTSQNYDEPQYFTVTAVDDGAVEGTHSASVGNTVTGDAAFVGALPPIQITITDNDVAPNADPVPTDDQASTSEDQSVDVPVLGNDSDPNGDPLIVSAVTQGAHGTVTIVGTQIRYSPAANFNGSDGFQYTVSDGSGGTAVGHVQVTVTPANDDPTAAPDQATTTASNPVTIAVLGNDGDVDGDALTITAVTQPSGGSVAIISAGQQLQFTPGASFSGVAQLSYTVSDGNGGSALGTVQVTVTASGGGGGGVQRVDLAVSVRGPGAVIDRREPFAITVTEQSRGPAASPGATLRTTLPNGLDFTGATGASCVERTRILTCQLGGLGADQRSDISLKFVAASRGIHLILLNVQGTLPDPVPLNNTGLVAVVVR